MRAGIPVGNESVADQAGGNLCRSWVADLQCFAHERDGFEQAGSSAIKLVTNCRFVKGADGRKFCAFPELEFQARGLGFAADISTSYLWDRSGNPGTMTIELALWCSTLLNE